MNTAGGWSDVGRPRTWDRKPKSNKNRAERHAARMGHRTIHDQLGWACLSCPAGRNRVEKAARA